MKELSLNILDVANNSVKAGATRIRIALSETEAVLTMVIADNGCGMTAKTVQQVMDPFFTTQTSRRVGLGLPFLKMAAEQTGGDVKIRSRYKNEYPQNHGTEITARFYKKHIDFTPLGDIVSTMVTLVQGNPEIDFSFNHDTELFHICLNTEQMREILGNEILLSEPSILSWISQYLRDQYLMNNK